MIRARLLVAFAALGSLAPLYAQRLERPAEIRVLDAATAAPLEGATLATAEERRVAAGGVEGARVIGVADGDGMVSTRALPRSTWWVVSAPGHVPAMADDWPPPVVELAPGVAVEVELRDPLERPCAGVVVDWLLGCRHTPPLRSVVTDARGRAVLADVDALQGWLRLTWPDGTQRDVPGWRRPWRVGDPPLLLRVLPPWQSQRKGATGAAEEPTLVAFWADGGDGAVAVVTETEVVDVSAQVATGETVSVPAQGKAWLRAQRGDVVQVMRLPDERIGWRRRSWGIEWLPPAVVSGRAIDRRGRPVEVLAAVEEDVKGTEGSRAVPCPFGRLRGGGFPPLGPESLLFGSEGAKARSRFAVRTWRTGRVTLWLVEAGGRAQRVIQVVVPWVGEAVELGEVQMSDPE